MSRYYGMFVKGTAKTEQMLDLTTIPEFERTGNLKSSKLYYFKELIKLTSQFDNEIKLKYYLYRRGLIKFDDITKELSMRSVDNGKVGKNRLPLIYKPLLELFKPKVLREKYVEKFDVEENYYFLEGIVSKFSGYRHSVNDKKRYSSEIIIDEIYSIIKNYDPTMNFDEKHKEYFHEHKDYFNNRLKFLLSEFVNHEIFYVIGKMPNSYNRVEVNVYRKEINSETGKEHKCVDLYSLYKLVLYLVSNDKNLSMTTGIASEKELIALKEVIVDEIEQERLKREKYTKEAIELAEQDREMFSSQYNDSKIKKRTRKINKEIEGQETFNL